MAPARVPGARRWLTCVFQDLDCLQAVTAIQPERMKQHHEDSCTQGCWVWIQSSSKLGTSEMLLACQNGLGRIFAFTWQGRLVGRNESLKNIESFTDRGRSVYSSRSWRCWRRWGCWCRNWRQMASIDGWVPYQSTGTVHDVTLLIFTALNIFSWIFMWKVEFAFCCILGRTWVVVVTIISNLLFNRRRWCYWVGELVWN